MCGSGYVARIRVHKFLHEDNTATLMRNLLPAAWTVTSGGRTTLNIIAKLALDPHSDTRRATTLQHSRGHVLRVNIMIMFHSMAILLRVNSMIMFHSMAILLRVNSMYRASPAKNWPDNTKYNKKKQKKTMVDQRQEQVV